MSSSTVTRDRKSATPSRFRRNLGLGASIVALGAGAEALAQEAPAAEEDAPESIEERIDDAAAGPVQDEVVVTGSRIRRDAFTSIAPVQVIDGDLAREIGFTDTANLLQSSVAASGVQINNSFQGFVLDNGPLTETVGLRGLGAARTLVLMNSKRVAPSGAGAAPTAVNLGVYPITMVDRIDELLDGASSVYGSDAVAGVVNIILRDDLDGLELQGNYDHTLADGGEEGYISAAWGKVFDRGSFGISAQYQKRKAITYGDRDFLRPCDRNFEEDQNGVLRSDDVSLAPGNTVNECDLFPLNNRIFIPVAFGSVYYTPGSSNINIPNFSESTLPVGFAGFDPSIKPVDLNGDGVPDTAIVDGNGDNLQDFDFKDPFYTFQGTGRDLSTDFVPERDSLSIYSYGNYSIGAFGNAEIFYEALYNQSSTSVFSPGAQLFPTVPADNPTNPCNQATGGVNCLDFFAGTNFGNLEVDPIVMIRGDRDRADIEASQFRFVGGARGDISAFDGLGPLSGWSYEAFVSYDRTSQSDERQVILEPNLNLALDTTVIDPATGDLVCGSQDADGDGVPEPGPDDDVLGRGLGCVPVNLFADSVFQEGGGTFATQAEADYLFGIRSIETDFTQIVASGIVQGDLFTLWNGTQVPLVAGFEFRRDSVNSIPNSVAGDGLAFGFFNDGGAVGARNLYELFGETSITPLADRTLAEELTFEGAARWTEESTYGSAWTYSVRGLYAPFDFLRFRSTYGTSFRAPNAREQFLRGQSGFNFVSDPCIVPDDARNQTDPAAPPTYVPELDTRQPTILDNCRAQGVDPTSLGLSPLQFPSYSVEITDLGSSVANAGLGPETSKSLTAGVVFDQTFFDSFELKLAATYYSIEIDDAINQLSAQSLVNECYAADAFRQDFFCPFTERDPDGFIGEINQSFFNVASETSKGYDFTGFFSTDFVVAGRNLDLTLDMLANRVTENTFQFGDDTAIQDDVGRIATPKWRGRLIATVGYADFRFNWFSQYFGSGDEEVLGEVPLNPDGVTCFNDVNLACKPFGRTDAYYLHNFSVAWEPRDDFVFTVGLNNAFNARPPLVSNDATGPQRRNIALGAPYDVFGRSVNITITKRF